VCHECECRRASSNVYTSTKKIPVSREKVTPGRGVVHELRKGAEAEGEVTGEPIKHNGAAKIDGKGKMRGHITNPLEFTLMWCRCEPCTELQRNGSARPEVKVNTVERRRGRRALWPIALEKGGTGGWTSSTGGIG